ncbi:MAG: hypothetical protein J6Z14_08745 [Prevotella sp.]|nr:hypothetical protein [Prevotella sp.]
MKKFTLTLVAAVAICTAATAQNRVKNVYASSPKLNVEQLQNQEQTVQVNRYFFAGYNTLCLPMSMTADQLAEAATDITVERLAAIGQEGNVLNLYFVPCTSEGIEAGVPYLVYSPKAQYLRVKNTEAMTIDSELKAVRMIDGQGNQVTFSSSWEAMAKDGRYGIPAQQNVTPLQSILVRTEGDKTFLPTRCGFSWDEQSSTANELKIQHITLGELTAIEGVEAAKAANGIYYDLNGHKMNGQLKKGVYVKDGGKVLVK